MPTLIYDPTAAQAGKHVNGWRGLVYNDFDAFSKVFWSNRNCLVILDEAPDLFIHRRRDVLPMILRGRHQGHVNYMIAQRHVLMEPSARTQANHLMLFTVAPDDADSLAREWNCPDLRQASNLRPRQYISLVKHGKPVFHG